MAKKKQNYTFVNGNLVQTDNIAPITGNYVHKVGEIAPINTINTVTNSKKKKEWWEQIVEAPTIFDDGYQPGELIGTVLGSTADAGLNLVKGIVDIGEGIAKVGAGAVADVIDVFAGENDYTKGVRERIQQDAPVSQFLNYLKDQVSDYSIFGDTGDQIFRGIGYTTGMYYGGMALPNGGNITLQLGEHVANLPILSAVGGASSGLEGAYSKGATGLQAWEKALGSGVIESVTESLFGFMGVGGNDITEEMTKKIVNKFESGVAKNLAKLGISSTAEGLEEVLSYTGNQILDKLIDRASGENDPKFYEKWDWNQVAQEFTTSFLSTAIHGGFSNITSIHAMTNNAINNFEQQAGRELTAEEKQSLQDQVSRAFANENTLNIQKVLDAEFNNRISKIENPTLNDRARIRYEVNQDLQNYNININTINQALGEEIINNWNNQYKALQELKQKIDNTDDNSSKGKLQKQYDQLLQDYRLDDHLRNIYADELNKNKDFTYTANENMSDLARSTYESTKNLQMNNTKYTHDIVDFASKMADYTGKQILFTNNEQLKQNNKLIQKELSAEDNSQLQKLQEELAQKTENKAEAKRIQNEIDKLLYDTPNGLYEGENGSILVNVDSDKATMSIIGHEVSHMLDNSNEGEKLRKLAIEYTKQKGEYEKRMEQLKKAYEKVENANLDIELTNDVIGDYLFNDQKFVEQFAMESPSIFKKIYNWFKHVLKLATTGSKEARQLEKMRYNLEKGLAKINEGKLTDTNVGESGKEINVGINKVKYSTEYLTDDTPYTVLDKDLSNISAEKRFIEVKKYISNLDGQLINDIDNNQLLIIRKLVGNDGNIHDIAGEITHHSTTFQKQIDKEYRKELKQKILMQIEETLQNSNLKQGKPDIDGRHLNYNITDFDKSIGLVYDGKNMYQVTYDVAVLQDGTRVPYDLKQVSKHNSSLDLMQQKKNSDTIATVKKTASDGFTPSSYEHSISENAEKVNDSTKNNYSLSEQLEKNLEKTVLNAESERQAKIDNFKSYMEENDIKTPTIQDIYNSFDDYQVADSNDTGKTISQIEEDYYQTIANYLDSQNISLKDNNEKNIAPIEKGGIKSVNQKDIVASDSELEQIFGKQINENYDQALAEADKYKYSLKDKQNVAPTKSVKLEENRFPENIDKSFAPYLEFAVENDMLPEFDNIDKEVILKGVDKEAKPTIKEVLSNTDSKTDIRTLTPQKSSFQKFMNTINFLFVNRNDAIDRLSKESGNLRIKWLGDMLNGVSGEVEASVNMGQTDNNGKQIGKSINDLFNWSRDENVELAFNDYLFHYSNIDRHANGVGSATPLNVSKDLVKAYEKTYPQFKEHAIEVWEYFKNELHNYQEAGLINSQWEKYWRSTYPHYVPFMKELSKSTILDDSGKIKPTGVIKKAKGGASDIITVEDAMKRYTYNVKKAIRQNALFREISNTLSGDKMLIGFDNRIDPADIGNQSLYTDENGAYLLSYENGEQSAIRINDELYNQLNKTLEKQIRQIEENLSFITNPLQKASNIRRNLLTTWSPSFILKNPIKDFGDALINSTDTKAFIRNYVPSFIELLQNKTESVKQFKALYGSANTMGESDSFNAKGIFQRIANFNEIVELAPRYAEFKSTIERGGSIQEAMYNAREVTINFNRGGVITKAMNRNGFTFLNASVQGFDKFIRNFSEQRGAQAIVGVLAKATMYGVLPALFNHLIYSGGDEPDEDYEALPDYIKDNYYLIKTDGNNFIRIPKGRIPAVFGMTARRMLEYTQGESDAFKGLGSSIYSQVGVNSPSDNNILAPIMQAYFSGENGRAWYGGDLVPTRLQNKPNGEQYDESTDAFSKWMGETFGINPYKLNYVIDQYTGGIGDMFIPMITEEASSDVETPLDFMLAPIKDQFIVNSTMDNKYAGDFYSTKDDLTKLANSYKATDEDILRNKYMSSVSSELSHLYKEKHEVQSDSNLSKKEKYAKVQEIQNEINRLAKEGMDNYNNISKTNNYAIVGDREYYKDGDEWTKVDSKELEQLDMLGLDLNEKSSYYNSKTNISEIADEYNEALNEANESQKEVLNAYKKSDIIQVVKNSNLTDEAKAYLYTKYYGDYDVVSSLVTLGIDMDSYLDLESQNFSSDKYVNGKTISNSKKRKVLSYINSMNISNKQKILLMKLKYPSINTYNEFIIKYIQSNNELEYVEKKKLLERLGFTIENNKITW